MTCGVAVLSTLALVIIQGGIWLVTNDVPVPPERPPVASEKEKKDCAAVRPEWDSALITETRRLYWTMQSGKIKVCVRERT